MCAEVLIFAMTFVEQSEASSCSLLYPCCCPTYLDAALD